MSFDQKIEVKTISNQVVYKCAHKEGFFGSLHKCGGHKIIFLDIFW